MSKVFLDANVPMYAAGKDHALREPCQWIMVEISEGRLSAVIDAEIVQEILYRYGAIKKRQTGARLAKNVMSIVPEIISVTSADMETTIELYELYNSDQIPARGCLHAAVMINNGIEEIISVDGEFDLIKEVKRTDPREIAPG